jgi:sialic acid synthase SpsE
MTPMKIIADVGSNWLSQTHLHESIVAAKNAGATAVKFQCFKLEELYGRPLTNTTSMCDIEQFLPDLKKTADDVSIEFMCTFFSPAKLLRYQNLITTTKIASSDINYYALISAANSLKKPVMISTAGAYNNDIASALFALKDCHTTIMYCHGEYPSITHDLNDIWCLEEAFPTHALGYSDHTIDIYTPYIAARCYPICAIEKHFKLFDMDTPDNLHSLDPNHFRAMVDNIKGLKASSTAKLNFRNKHIRRLVAIRDIKAGEMINSINCEMYRSLTSTPFDLLSLDDNKQYFAKTDIKAWSALTSDNTRTA